jgi:hypothetical protein
MTAREQPIKHMTLNTQNSGSFHRKPAQTKSSRFNNRAEPPQLKHFLADANLNGHMRNKMRPQTAIVNVRPIISKPLPSNSSKPLFSVNMSQAIDKIMICDDLNSSTLASFRHGLSQRPATSNMHGKSSSTLARREIRVMSGLPTNDISPGSTFTRQIKPKVQVKARFRRFGRILNTDTPLFTYI